MGYSVNDRRVSEIKTDLTDRKCKIWMSAGTNKKIERHDDEGRKENDIEADKNVS